MNKNCTHCKSIQDKWTTKLEESGFEDAESDENNLKIWSSRWNREHTVDSWQAKATYYQMATNFLNEYKFDKDLDAAIWEYYSNGLGTIEITRILKEAKIKTNRTTVGLTIKKLKHLMYDMYLSPKKAYYE